MSKHWHFVAKGYGLPDHVRLCSMGMGVLAERRLEAEAEAKQRCEDEDACAWSRSGQTTILLVKCLHSCVVTWQTA